MKYVIRMRLLMLMMCLQVSSRRTHVRSPSAHHIDKDIAARAFNLDDNASENTVVDQMSLVAVSQRQFRTVLADALYMLYLCLPLPTHTPSRC